MTLLTDDKIIDGVKKGEVRSVARLLTISENNPSRGWEILSKLPSASKESSIIGITGSPGSGKSTLVDLLALEYSKRGYKPAIIAVDPTSPFSGGAILGDRIRMNKAAELSQIFIRSMATRGALGGLSRTSFEAISVLECAGFDPILLETVGVGQVEVDIVRLADTSAVVVVPGMGDAVQTFKAGILEIADLFIINKADRDGVDMVERDLRLLLSLGSYGEDDWTPAILRTVASKEVGYTTVVDNLINHHTWLKQSGRAAIKRKELFRSTILTLLGESIQRKAHENFSQELHDSINQCLTRKTNPYFVARQLSDKLLK